MVRDGQETKETAYYVTSLLGTAAHLNRIIREHWQIEPLHWQLDVSFQEDACKVTDRNAQLNLNILRKLCLAVALHSYWASEEQKRVGTKKKPRLKDSMKGVLLCNVEHMTQLFSPIINMENLLKKA